MAELLYQGHGSYRITTGGGFVVYVDPSLGEGYDVPADAVIVTHEHPDHNRIWRVPMKESCVVLRAADFQPSAGEYPTITLPIPHEDGVDGALRMTGVQACNANHPIERCVGVVLEFDGLRFYAAGDTSTTDDMRNGKLAGMNLDYATFPADGFYNMGVEEASVCAELVAAAHSMPMHLVPAHDVDSAELFDEQKAAEFSGPGKLVIRPGETVQL